MNEILKKRIDDFASDVAERYYKNSTDGEKRAAKDDVKRGAAFILCRQWISVDEALPELDEETLVLFPDGSKAVASRHKTFNAFGDEVIVWINGDYTYDDSWIKFWMPIPKFEPK